MDDLLKDGGSLSLPGKDGRGASPVGYRLWNHLSHGPGDCWTWRGHVDPGGYGSIALGRRSQRVHRVAYELLVGQIPAGLSLDHLCENKRCVNPAHLEPVSRGENVRRHWRRRRAEMAAKPTALSAMDVVDLLITETANEANRLASQTNQFDAIGAGTGVGIRLRALKDARAALLSWSLRCAEERVA